MRLSQLLERLEYEVVQGTEDIAITTLINDSRKVEPGSVFVCISGAVSDGHRFAAEVADKGAAALIVEKEVEVPGDVTVIRVEDTRYALALMSADVEARSGEQDLDAEEAKLRFDKLRTSMLKFIQRFQWGIWARSYVLHWKNVSEVVSALSAYLNLTNEEKYAILETDSTRERF